MKLFLASSDKTLPLIPSLFSKTATKRKVLFVANAADPYTVGPYSKKFWVEADRKAFLELGLTIQETDLREISKDQFEDQISNCDLLHFCGGVTLYLIQLLKDKNLFQSVIDSVRKNRIIYSGTSAGSIATTKSVELYSRLEYDEIEKPYVENIKNFEGLGLVDFIIVPHCNQPEFIKEHEKMMGFLSQNGNPLIFLHDNQAILVENEKFQIVSN